MRSRLMLLFSLVLVVTSAFIVSAPFAPAGGQNVVVAQEDGGGGDEGSGEGDGQGDPEAETGAGEGQTEEVAEETGPPWTYQMAWITLALLALMGIGLVVLYYRLVVQRRKSGA